MSLSYFYNKCYSYCYNVGIIIIILVALFDSDYKGRCFSCLCIFSYTAYFIYTMFIPMYVLVEYQLHNKYLQWFIINNFSL